MPNIQNHETTRGFALLHLGFRPFFLGAATYAVLSVLIWMALYPFGWQIQLHGLRPAVWHAHEMIYGYSMAVVAGFLLTAVKSWTGMQTLTGHPLLLLLLLWAAGRFAPFIGGIPDELIAVTDNLFLAFLFLAVTWPLLQAKQWAQIGIASKILLMMLSNVLFYLGVFGIVPNGIKWGLYTGLYLILALIFTMGRRVIPFFIERGVGYPIKLKNWRWLDMSSLVLFVLFWVSDVLVEKAGMTALLAGCLFVLHTIRLTGWYTSGIWRNPLLWVLYLGYSALVVGFALKVATFFFGVSPSLAVHAFAFGGVGMITVGMMSRVSLGHTGRSVLEPPPALSWAYAILGLGAVVRVIFPLVDRYHYVVWIGVSQVLWIISFCLFLVVFAPILIRPRIDEE